MDLPDITDEDMKAGAASARTYTLMILRKTPKYASDPNAQTIVWEHGRRNYALRAAGLLSIVCPVRDDSDLAGIGIFNADLEQTTEILDGDPGVQAGIFTYEAHLCRGFPGDSLPA